MSSNIVSVNENESQKNESSLSSFEKVLEDIESPTYSHDLELFDKFDSLLTVPISSTFLPVTSPNEITMDFSPESSLSNTTTTTNNNNNNLKYPTLFEDETSSFIDSFINFPYLPHSPQYNTTAFLPKPLDYQDIIRPASNVVPSNMLSYNTNPMGLNMMISSSSSSSSPSPPSISSSLPLTFKKGKKCCVQGCIRRAQSNSRCKAHGGGARCQFQGCNRSSQGGGFCRSHGGGKKCQIEGCNKGTQRNGLCFFHGGIRICQHEGCTKKDRGNGFCISHGGGKKCQVISCERLIRRGAFCPEHTEMIKPYKRLSSLQNTNTGANKIHKNNLNAFSDISMNMPLTF